MNLKELDELIASLINETKRDDELIGFYLKKRSELLKMIELEIKQKLKDLEANQKISL